MLHSGDPVSKSTLYFSANRFLPGLKDMEMVRCFHHPPPYFRL